MRKKANLMKYEIRTIANYRGLILSKYYIAVLLSLMSLYLGHTKQNPSSLYILVILAVLPYALSSGLRDYSGKGRHPLLVRIASERHFLLDNLKKTYHYTSTGHIANSVTYPILLILIGLWQYKNNSSSISNDFLRNAPVFIISSGLLLRLAGTAFYRLKLPHDLFHNQVR